MKLRGLFVTGTDTAVGKTTFSIGFLRHARRLGIRPIPFKPVETGYDAAGSDASALWRAAGPAAAEAGVCLYRLRLAAAPSVAAAAEGVSINLESILDHAEHLATQGDFILVEGAGGLLVPYAESETGADLARRLALPVVVVARTALGTVNHTALTLREADRNGLDVAAVVLNRVAPGPEQPHEATNGDLIERLTGRRPIGVLPHVRPQSTIDPDALPDGLADALFAGLGAAGIDRLLAAAGCVPG
jgi:dethiobiotin synthetase